MWNAHPQCLLATFIAAVLVTATPAESLDRTSNIERRTRSSHAKGLCRQAYAYSGQVVTQIQSGSSRTDSLVRSHMPSQPVGLHRVVRLRAQQPALPVIGTLER
jgi:hypothetical protein